MNTFYLGLCKKGVEWLLGSENWKTVVEKVSLLMFDQTKTGDEKREVVVSMLGDVIRDVGSGLVNLAVEVAVQWLKSRMLAS